MKRKRFACALLLLLVSVSAYGTVAYFTAEGAARNVITAARHFGIEIVESAVKEDGTQIPFENVSGVMPGCEVSKIAQVRNTGEADAYIRVQAESRILLAQGVEGTADPHLVSLDFNRVDWTERDGYYYYDRALKPGELTAPLFTTVTFASTMDCRYQNCTVVIDVNAYATQSANNGAVPWNAQGWTEGGEGT